MSRIIVVISNLAKMSLLTRMHEAYSVSSCVIPISSSRVN